MGYTPEFGDLVGQSHHIDPDMLESALSFLGELPGCYELPALVLKLKKRFPHASPESLSLAAEIFSARSLAPEKLGAWASQGYFSLGVLQQASRAAVAACRARRFAGGRHVLEIGTGSGCDTAALARVSAHVTTIDADAATTELARRNLELLGITNVTFQTGDAQELVPAIVASCDALFADPARRSRAGQRVKDAEEYSPPLSWVLGLQVKGVRAIKVSPGLFVEPLPQGCARQFVGVGAECLEQTLWFGTDVVDSSVLLADIDAAWAPPALQPEPAEAQALEGYICEAHAVMNRSQHLQSFFAGLGIASVAPDVAYGIASRLPAPSPFLSRFLILSAIPFQPKQLKAALGMLRWSNRTEFKKRAVPLDPEAVRAEMKLPDHSHESPFGVVFLLPWQGKPWAVIAERIT